MTWTQPLCIDCWTAENGERKPVTLIEKPIETCCKCGRETQSGIYVRVDPATVPFPTTEEAQ